MGSFLSIRCITIFSSRRLRGWVVGVGRTYWAAPVFSSWGWFSFPLHISTRDFKFSNSMEDLHNAHLTFCFPNLIFENSGNLLQNWKADGLIAHWTLGLGVLKPFLLNIDKCSWHSMHVHKVLAQVMTGWGRPNRWGKLFSWPAQQIFQTFHAAPFTLQGLVFGQPLPNYSFCKGTPTSLVFINCGSV